MSKPPYRVDDLEGRIDEYGQEISALEQKVESLEAELAKYRPIPILEKNAPIGRPVFVYFACFYEPTWFWAVQSKLGKWHNSDTWENFEGEQPTHWMPLPPIPIDIKESEQCESK